MFTSPPPSVSSVLPVQAPHLQPGWKKARVIWRGTRARTFNDDDKKNPPKENVREQANEAIQLFQRR